MTDFLARQYDDPTTIFFNGGAQRAHNVVADGKHHTFCQFGSGTFAGAGTHHSRFSYINPGSLFTEGNELRKKAGWNVYDKLTIDGAAPITTPWHVGLNRIREIARGKSRHGSCGMGIGETSVDVLRGDYLTVEKAAYMYGADLFSLLRAIKYEKRREAETLLDSIEDHKVHAAAYKEFRRHFDEEDQIANLVEVYRALERFVCRPDVAPQGNLIFEHSQGVLLDERFGFAPYHTWTNCTDDNANTVLAEMGFKGVVQRMGILRGYMTRHGEGPLPTYNHVLSSLLSEPHNRFNSWQGGWRSGWTDLVLARYATSVIERRMDILAVTCMDSVQEATKLMPPSASWMVAEAYTVPTMGNQVLVDLPLATGLYDIPFQERLTRLLEACRPLLTSVPVWDVPELLARTVGAEAWMASSGPRAEQKGKVRMVSPR